ncbi:DnaJ domain-containing protein [Desulfococcaceae bacterium HSG8]|nr:DnaJ domain-containing protein [Desulfococcaceae bacterium HSG8]
MRKIWDLEFGIYLGFTYKEADVLTYYLTLGLSLDASDEDIRNSYLQLVKKHTPEKDPTRFRQITEAYESLKNQRKRIEGKMLGGLRNRDYEESLLSLGRAQEIKPRRVGLKELFQAEKELRG